MAKHSFFAYVGKLNVDELLLLIGPSETVI